MAKTPRPKTNSASAAIRVMDTMGADFNRSWFVAELAREADLSIHAVTRALRELDGICVERRKLQWILLPEPADIPDEKVLLEPENGADLVEDLLDYLRREEIEYHGAGYSRKNQSAYYEVFTQTQYAKVGAIIHLSSGRTHTIRSVQRVGYFSRQGRTLEDAIKLTFSGRGSYAFFGADEIVHLRYYWSPNVQL